MSQKGFFQNRLVITVLKTLYHCLRFSVTVSDDLFLLVYTQTNAYVNKRMQTK